MQRLCNFSVSRKKASPIDTFHPLPSNFTPKTNESHPVTLHPPSNQPSSRSVKQEDVYKIFSKQINRKAAGPDDVLSGIL